ncbi:hypothetical protein [Cupriavidus campinensis]
MSAGHAAPIIETQGSIGPEVWLFNRSPAYSEQNWNAAALVMNLGWVVTDPAYPGLTARLTPYVRLDVSDPDMRYFDLREATLRAERGDNLWQAGMETLDWSVMESRHPVNIVNQIDTRADIDLEAKLGQPMLSYTRFDETYGRLALYWMPWFRPRPLLGTRSRQRLEPAAPDPAPHGLSPWVRTDDVAVRWSGAIADADVSAYYFDGLSREPDFAPDLTTYYRRIRQFGLTGVLPAGSMLWKGEAIYRWGQGRPFGSYLVGAEYTFARPGGDLSLLFEYLRDHRGASAPPTPFTHGPFAGVRFRFNEPGDAELQYGVLHDRATRILMHKLEFTRRFGKSARLRVVARKAICNGDSSLEPLCRDSMLQVNLSHNF